MRMLAHSMSLGLGYAAKDFIAYLGWFAADIFLILF
jgi:hypothetical protein